MSPSGSVRGSPWTMSRSISGSLSKRLICAGARRSWIALIAKIASSELRGAEQVPGHRLRRAHGDVVDLVVEGVRDRLALGDVADRVDVACALRCTTLLGSMLPVRRASAIAAAAPAPVGSGAAAWKASLLMPTDSSWRVDLRAARDRVVVGLEHEDRRALADDEAVTAGVVGARGALGSSLRVERACIAAKPPIGSGWIAASVPPAMTTPARPERSVLIALPIASAPEAHALTRAARHRLELDGDGAGRAVDQQHRDREREDAARSLGAQGLPRGDEGGDAADAGADGDGEVLGRDVGLPASAQASREAMRAYCAHGSWRSSTFCRTPTAGRRASSRRSRAVRIRRPRGR